MKVLVVCSGNKSNGEFRFALDQPFIYEQTKSLELLGIEFELFLIKGKGIFGYLRNIRRFRNTLRNKNFDVVHAHNGPSGFIAILQRYVPVIITFHGSDINLRYINILSSISSLFASWRIFVSQKLYDKIYLKPKKRFSIIPCGININEFNPIDKLTARKELNLDLNKKYILFASAFDNKVKNFPLAKKALESIIHNYELIELKKKTRREVMLLLNACDILLLTSKSEGSPQVIKEAMACNCPIITTDVGDVHSIIKNTEHCFICTFDPEGIADKIRVLLEMPVRTKGRDLITSYDNNKIAREILNIYIQYGLGESYQQCQLGIWDTSVPGIRFDVNGISNYAKIQQHLMKDYPLGETGKAEWLRITEDIRNAGKGNRYDCIIGVSGGTDSSYLMHIAKENGLRPLAVNLDNGWNSDIAVKNIKKITTSLQIDLETYVIDYEEIKDLMRAFMRAELPWIDTPTDLAIQSILYKIASREKIKYILIGNDFRSEGKQPTEWTYGDQRLLRHVHRKFGEVKLKTFPLLSLSSLIFLGYVRGIKMIPPFNYLEYDKPLARDFLINKFGWEYYGEHHHENLFTKWAIGYWGYEKMGIDKRMITYSAQILNGKISREDALRIVGKPSYNSFAIKEETEYVIKKLGISDTEFETIWSSPGKSFKDYPSYYPLIYKFARLIVPLLKHIIPIKPKIFYEIEGRE
jgi:N-acetyl sugar amidotransferase